MRRVLGRLLRSRREVFLADRDDLKKYKIGRWSYGDLSVLEYRRSGNLTIGAFCSFAASTEILLGGDHNPRNISTYPFGVLFGGAEEGAHASSKGNVTIGNDVWMGRRAVVLSGVSVGDGAVIGAGSVVTRSVPSYAVVAGNPARIVRMRFSDDTIEKLLQIRWWDWPDEQIRQSAKALLSDDVESFLKRNSRIVSRGVV